MDGSWYPRYKAQFYKSDYFNVILSIFSMPANNRKDVFLKRNREKWLWWILVRNNKRRKWPYTLKDWVVMRKGSISLGLLLSYFKNCFSYKIAPHMMMHCLRKSHSLSLSLYRKILKGSKFHFHSLQINFICILWVR